MNNDFPEAPAQLFLIGVGGIGMSALAQFLITLGYEVAGSDRDLTTPAQVHLFGKLRKQGIKIYQQDGSGVNDFKPQAIIYSSAIEESNPDFTAAGDTPRFHRSIAMASAVNRSGLKQIAVAGSCGKTSVTGWIASALEHLGSDPVMINGGYTGEFITDKHPGNFKPGENYIVYEADESDGSLVNFRPDTALLLNLGIDHYEKEELDEFFQEYLSNGKSLVVSNELSYLIPQGRRALTFTENVRSGDNADFTAAGIEHNSTGVAFKCKDTFVQTKQFGDHSAANALAVFAVLNSCGFCENDSAEALQSFTGVARRFDFKGNRGNKRIYDDYAHNVQKIAACIETAQGLSGDPVYAVFQPHGYGPLGFMRDSLKEQLKQTLRSSDRFIFLPVFYAGGSTSFEPTSDEVAKDFAKSGLKTYNLEERNMLGQFLDKENEAAAVVILGARDPSLADWCQSLVKD